MKRYALVLAFSMVAGMTTALIEPGHGPWYWGGMATVLVIALIVGMVPSSRGSRQALIPESTDSVDGSRAGTTESAEWAFGRPNTGALVRLIRYDAYLAGYHRAPRGMVGTVVGWSHLNPDDDGVLVDWGDGQEVRTDLDEIEPFADHWAAPCLSVNDPAVGLEPWKCILPAGHEGLHRAAHPRVKWATADEAVDL